MASGSQNMTTFKAKGLTSIANAVDTSNFIFLKSTTLTADQLGNTVSLSLNATAVTGAAYTNHSIFLNAGVGSGLGTPFQLQIPDSSHLYIYKRWYTSGAWSGWSKMRAGTADTWTTARTLTIGDTGKTVDGSANVSWSKDEILGGSGTTAFLRADKSWTNTLTGPFYSTGSPGFQNVTAAGTWAYLQLKSGTLGWDIASNSSQNSGALDFRPHQDTNKGIMITQSGGLYFKNPATGGIYYKGTKSTYRMIRFIDNASDEYGNGISIGGGGLTLIGGGESADTLISSLNLTTSGGTETLYVASDNSIEFYPDQQSYSAAARIWMTAGVLNIGVDGNTTRENSLNIYSGAGRLQLYSAASTTGNRGLWVPAHGSGSSKNIILIDTDNNTTFTGNLTGNAATATNLVGISMTGGNGNTGGRRLIYTWTINAWSNHRLTFAVSSRHTGSGLVAVSVGCNSSTVSLANCYAEIKYFGTTDSGGIISATSYEIYINSAGTTAYLFWQYTDYNATSITPISGGLPSNGTWTTNPASYGTLKAQTEINPSSVCYGNAATATTASTLASYASIGSSTTDHGVALKNWFTANKSTAPRNKIISFYSATSGNGSQYMGYFLSGYADNPYGGFFVCHYNNPYYVGISNGTYTQQHILTSTNYTSYTVTKTGSGASGTWGIDISGNAATATALKDKTNGTSSYLDYGRTGITDASKFTWLCVWDGYTVAPASKAAITSAVKSSASGSWGISVTGSSASCTGNAASATKLGTDAGNANTPVYFTGGKPSACNNKLGAQSANGYWGMGSADNAFNVWIRTTTLGIIPYQSGGKGSGHCGIGTSSWYFSTAYIDTITSNKTYGAVWNDIAECRKTIIKEPGRVVIENKSGIMELSSIRMQATGRIISDTYGYCMGEPANDGTPIAIAGRVLVYPYRKLEEYNLGDCVCSAPNGTVDIMTREEIKEYPDRIVGIVSEIPTYEVWSGGAQNGKDDIQVNGRIWIYVR